MTGSIRTDCNIPGLAGHLFQRGIRIDPEGSATLIDISAVTVPLLSSLRERGPVILLVGSLDDVPIALDAGADDAVLRDAAPEEIAARIAARLRMSAPPIGIGELIIDRVTRKVTRAGKALGLMPREYALLLHLAQHAGEPVPRTELLRDVWGLRFDPGTNVVAVHVSRLRAKLDRDFAAPMLRTEKGVGYRLAAD